MKYFANVKSYTDLKETYKKLLKANHPDNGGDLETMQEINAQYDIAFRIWKSKATADNSIKESEKEETAQSTRKKFYTAFGWEGSRYNSRLTLKEIAKIVRGYVKEKYPNCKFSVRTHYASMCQELSVEIKEFDGKMYKTAEQLKESYYTQFTYVNNSGETITSKMLSDEIQSLVHKLSVNDIFTQDSWTDDELLNCYTETVFEKGKTFFGVKTEHFQSVLDDVNSFVNSYNYSDCDGQIDYFDVNFYYFDCGYTDCIEVVKTARINKKEAVPANTANNEKETANKIETTGELYTICESTHTKTGETIYLVKWLDKLSRDNYIKLNEQIKKIGGYYSKFTHSFIFKENPVELMKEVKIA